MDQLLLIVILMISGPLLGSIIGVIHKPSEKYLEIMLAFSAGVMLTIAFLDLIPQSTGLSGLTLAIVGILVGVLFMYVLDKIIPHIHPTRHKHEKKLSNIKRISFALFLGLFLHNFPEGMTVAAGTVSTFKATLAIALTIAIHNIPEGICTSAPYYFATKKRGEAFWMSASTVIPTVVGFFSAYFLFQYISSIFISIIVAATAGLMIYISCDELIPFSITKKDIGVNHVAIFSLMIGVIFVLAMSWI